MGHDKSTGRPIVSGVHAETEQDVWEHYRLNVRQVELEEVNDLGPISKLGPIDD